MRQATQLNRPYPHFKFPFEITIEVSKMSDKHCLWHSVALNSWEFRCINYGWFPSDVLMGVVNRMYEDTNKIGANIGRNLGTASIAVLDKNKAIELLTKAGYNIIGN